MLKINPKKGKQIDPHARSALTNLNQHARLSSIGGDRPGPSWQSPEPTFWQGDAHDFEIVEETPRVARDPGVFHFPPPQDGGGLELQHDLLGEQL
jgi:hypothetical protein